ncbi:MAG: hypothetical protein ACFFFK_04370, partial [Candidatus Thorarchaeota archaeon]
IRKSSIVMEYDRDEAKELLEKAYQLEETTLGIPEHFAYIIDRLSVIEATRGAFDTASKNCLKVVNIRERVGLNTGNTSLLLSTLYNVMGEPESGLDWGRMAEDQFKSRPQFINRAILNQIWSLILLQQVTEAQSLIDLSSESILKSGDERQLAWLHFVTGVLEMEQGEPSMALSSIEQALQIYEQQGWAYHFQLIFLYYLAMVEVYSCDSKDLVSPFLAILEDRALSEDLPGFLGLSLLLKAEFSIMSKNEAQLRDIIKNLRSLSEKEGLQFLNPRYERLLEKL